MVGFRHFFWTCEDGEQVKLEREKKEAVSVSGGKWVGLLFNFDSVNASLSFQG